MAILNSPIMHGAKGKLDGSSLRQRYGRTIISARPSGKRSMNAAQLQQADYFGTAVETMRYVPNYPQRAYLKDTSKSRSAYNVCISNVVKAMRAASIPADSVPSFRTLVAALRSAGAFSAIGIPADVDIAISEGNIVVTAPEDAVMDVYYSTGAFAKMLQVNLTKDTESTTAVPAGATCVLCVVRINDQPVTLEATSTTLLSE